MIFNFQKFCQDFRIATAPRNHPHQRTGWINIECHFCTGHRGFHLGYNSKQDFFTCYRCGWHQTEKVLSVIAHLEISKIKALIQRYKGDLSKPDIGYAPDIIRPDSIELPPGTEPMTNRHKQYLASRKFDPDKLERIWNLKGTGHTGNYRFRIITPITFNHQLVSYQGRDITDKQFARYMACKEEEEIISHKHVLYGWDQMPYNAKSCIVVEGITGVWRLGPGALGTFGVKYTGSQVRLLTNRFEKVYLLFDPDEAGEQAEKMAQDLIGSGIEVEWLNFMSEKLDSGNIPQSTADKLMKEILK
ncbi:MAG: hypothetical protein KKF27_20400 [Gammaproteobacteria bacterium]|nr:hypothetical protein [Gammaproteobacteria bacterium]MBU2685609.1 hypothetical protein [Gammaproteobacteria bacterium]